LIQASQPELTAAQLQDLSGVQAVRRDDDQFSLAVAEPHITLPALLERLKELKRDLASLTIRHTSLEDVFVTLTGRHLRDSEPSPS
jgi:ABC-2 type transport system ATP-binding protein